MGDVMDWISMLKKRSTANNPVRQQKDKPVKQIQKEIEKKREEYKKMELRPCHGDLDLMQREKDLEQLQVRIHELERERDKQLYIGWHEA
jgi:hypothetical protein